MTIRQNILKNVLHVLLLLFPLPAVAYEFAIFHGQSKVTTHDLLPYRAQSNSDFFVEQYFFSLNLDGGHKLDLKFEIASVPGQPTVARIHCKAKLKGVRRGDSYKVTIQRKQWRIKQQDDRVVLELGAVKLAGNPKKFSIKIDTHTLYVNLSFGPQLSPWKPGNGKLELKNAGTYYIAIWPRLRVSGKIRFKDRKIWTNIKGTGRLFHSASSFSPQLYPIFWVQAVTPVRTWPVLLFQAVTLPDQYGGDSYAWFIWSKNGTHQAFCARAKVKFGDWTERSGRKVPQSILAKCLDSDIELGIKTTKFKKAIDGLRKLAKFERMIVSKFVRPITFLFHGEYQLSIGSKAEDVMEVKVRAQYIR